MEITLADIARELDLSAATVSRSLRHDRLINPETRARVNETARRLGYTGRVRKPRRPVERETKSGVLGLLLRHSSLEAAHHDSNLMKMMAGIMSVADEHGMHIKTHTHPSREKTPIDDEGALVPPLREDFNYQGLIAHGDQTESDLAFLAHRMPVVAMGRTYPGLPLDAAVADNVDGVSRLVARLIKLGHREMAWVGSYYNASFMEERQTGFVRGCLAAKLDLGAQKFFGAELYEKPHLRDGETLLKAARAGTTAFVCGNDQIALQVIAILEAGGLRVPDDVSVTGFDASRQTWQGLEVASVDPNFFEIGKIAARLTLQRMKHPLDQPCIVHVRGKIFEGQSVAPIKGI